MFSIEEIKKVLPHREPFLFLDEVIETNYEDFSIIAKKTFTRNLEIFKGHFPNNPITPGVIILEGMAQAGAFLVLSTDEHKGKITYFAGADKVKWKNPVFDNDTVTFKLQVIKFRHGVGTAQAFAYVNDTLACEAIIKVVVK